jgi:hypothetical protein
VGVEKPHKLAAALCGLGHKISAVSVKRLLPTLGYSRHSNRKADESSKHPDRDAQLEHINAKVIERQAPSSLCRRRRLERIACAPMESPITVVRRCDRANRPRPSLPAGNVDETTSSIECSATSRKLGAADRSLTDWPSN